MFMRVVHSAPVRIIQMLVGTWFFVEGSVAQGTTGLLMMAVGSVLVITAGANVSVFDPLFRRDAQPADHKSPDVTAQRAA